MGRRVSKDGRKLVTDTETLRLQPVYFSLHSITCLHPLFRSTLAYAVLVQGYGVAAKTSAASEESWTAVLTEPAPPEPIQ